MRRSISIVAASLLFGLSVAAGLSTAAHADIRHGQVVGPAERPVPPRDIPTLTGH